MFNGIIFNTGKVNNIIRKKNSIYVEILTNINFKKKDIGSSICCDGVCLTIERIIKNKIFFYIFIYFSCIIIYSLITYQILFIIEYHFLN